MKTQEDYEAEDEYDAEQDCNPYDKMWEDRAIQRGIKHDSTKPDLTMTPYSALVEEARVMEHGKAKYGRDNWRGGIKWTRVIAAALRHVHALNEGEDYDMESGLLHAAHARCCLAFLIEYLDTHKELDDRPKAARGFKWENNKIDNCEFK